VNIRPQTATGAQNAQKTNVGQQRVVNVINQPMVRPQSNTVSLNGEISPFCRTYQYDEINARAFLSFG